MLLHAPLLSVLIPGSRIRSRQESFDELIHGKRDYSILADKDNAVSSNTLGIN